MSIDVSSSLVANTSRVASQVTRPTARLIYDSTGTGLTAGDVELLRAMSGRDDFAWPPDPSQPDQMIPAVLPLAGYRADQVARGMRITELTEADIQQLVRKGIFNPEDGRRAKDSLRAESAAGASAGRQPLDAQTRAESGGPARLIGGEARLYL